MTSAQRLLAGRLVSFLATAMVPTALTLVIVDRSGNGAELGLVLAAELVPQLLLLPLGGVLVDRLPAARVAVAADVVRGVAQLLVGVSLSLGSVRIVDLVVLSAVMGVALAFGVPTTSPLIAAAVPPDRRLRVNSQLGFGRGVAFVVGPAVAGLLFVAFGATAAFVTAGMLFFVGATTLRGLPAASGEVEPGEGLVQGLRSGWVAVAARPWFWSSLIGHATSNLAAGAFMSLGPLIAIRQLGGSFSWVLIYQAGMVGMLLGAIGASRLRDRRPLVVTAVSGALFAVPLLALAVPLHAAAVAAGYAVAMGGVGILNAIWQTIVQREFDERMLARADSYDEIISLVARPVGLAVAAPLAVATGAAVPLLAGAGLVLVTNLAIVALPGVRDMPASRAPAVELASVDEALTSTAG